MPWNYTILDRLSLGKHPQLNHPSVELALSAAWASADAGGKQRLVTAMLHRRQTRGLELLIRRLHELGADARAELVRRAEDLDTPLRKCLGDPAGNDPTPPVNALGLIADGAAGGLADLATSRLRHAHPQVRTAAGACLRLLALKAPQMPPRSATRLADAVNGAVERFAHHRHPAALRAWLALAPRGLAAGGGVVEALQDPDHPAVGPMRELLQAAEGPEVRRGLIAALSFRTLALAATAGLRVCAAQNQLDPVLKDQEHLLDLPAVRRGLARVGDPTELWPLSLIHI